METVITEANWNEQKIKLKQNVFGLTYNELALIDDKKEDVPITPQAKLGKSNEELHTTITSL